MICSSWYGTCALLKRWLDSGGATADGDVKVKKSKMSRKRDPVPLRVPSKQTFYNSIGLSLTTSICTVAFGIAVTVTLVFTSPTAS